ncbi:MAG: beta-N-acetylglucosaminidase domain-containing protein [Pseudomonadota bacterium]
MTFLGVVEGFYGRPWHAGTRLHMLGWLAELGIDAYLYAPKADPWLRRRWRDIWPPSEQDLLTDLASAGRAADIEVGVGLSPFALYRDYNAKAREDLRTRVKTLVDCGVVSIALLFDDMPGDMDALAERQAEIAYDVFTWIGAVTLRLCPTYYSDDPTLDEFFGRRPENYLVELVRQLPPSCVPFWTGPEVCSTVIPAKHLEQLAHRLGRPVALWDNYPVNDSRSRSPHLYLGTLQHRAPADSSVLESHWCNAMNQAALSLPAVASLAELYGRDQGARDGVFAAAGLTPDLIRACLPLADCALEDLGGEQRHELSRLAEAPTPAARELSEWLAGEYVFDPACLTD